MTPWTVAPEYADSAIARRPIKGYTSGSMGQFEIFVMDSWEVEKH